MPKLHEFVKDALVVTFLLLTSPVRAFTAVDFPSSPITPPSPTLSAVPSSLTIQSLPSVPVITGLCLFPTLSGLYRREYTVSYAYGAAVSASAVAVLRSLCAAGLSLSSLPAIHALALVFYGLRLNSFLLYREVCLPRFRVLREKIEGRAPQGNRLKRLPFIATCSLLYACLVAPLYATATVLGNHDFASMSGSVTTQLVRLLVGTVWCGLLVTAAGDLQKSITKARRGEDHLVTGGLFSLLRHPNYTGEWIAWTSSCLAAVVASFISTASVARRVSITLASLLGAIGMNTVLRNATFGLEKKQAEKYGDLPAYQAWIQTSLVGVTKQLRD